jgi:hypothetical protein
MDASEAASGVADLISRFDSLQGAAADISSIFQDLDIGHAFTEGLHPLEMMGAALEVGVSLIQETRTALDDMVSAYEKAGDAVSKYYDQKERAAKSGSARDNITGEGLPPEVEAAMREQGALSMGFAAQGTWTRRFQNIGAGISDFVGGDDSNADALREGRVIAGRQREIDKNNEEEQARRDFAAKAETNRYRQEQADYDKWAKEQARIDEKERKAEEAALLLEAKNRDNLEKELGRAEEAAAKRRENFDNQQKRQAIGRDGFDSPDVEQAFRGGVVGFSSIFNAMASAAGGSKTDPVAERKKIQAEEKAHRDELAAKREAFDKDLFEKKEALEQKRIDEMKKGLGLA